MADCHHRVRHGYLPVGKDICRSIEKFSRDLVEYLSFVWNALWKDDIECGDSVRYDHYKVFIFDVVDIADLADIFAGLSWKIEIGLYNCCHNQIYCKILYANIMVGNAPIRLKIRSKIQKISGLSLKCPLFLCFSALLSGGEAELDAAEVAVV